jgi:DNA ligase (NAD+)
MSEDLDIIKKRIDYLTPELRRHIHLYHVKDDPVITDPEYDLIFNELVDLVTRYPQFKHKDCPTDKVGGAPIDDLKQVKHLIPMLSLANSMNADAVQDFLLRVTTELKVPLSALDICAELKYDGLSCAIVYRYGDLVQGSTRGDGETGEDVTANLRAVNHVPQYIAELKDIERFEIRGEVLMERASFKALNERQAAAGLKLFANPRNAAAGALRHSDPEITRQRSLHFYAYSLGKCSEEINLETDGDIATHPFGVKTQRELLAKFCSFGFVIASTTAVMKATEVAEHFKSIEAQRDSLPFEIDGVVYKVNKLTYQDRLGWKTRTPNFATAAKFKPQEAQTILLAIDIQVGRTGAQTPVARLKPVKVGGVTVTNVILHNADEIARKDLRIGDTVTVVRNGDVIPGIIGPVLDKRSDDAVPFQMPNTCPSCGGATHKEEDEAVTFCDAGLKCPAQRLEAIAHFVQREAMDLDGLGDATIAALLQAGLIAMPSDLYKLTEAQVMTLEGFGKRSAELLIKAVASVRNPELRRFIFALGIRNCGKGTSKRLTEAFGSFGALMEASRDQILAIKDIGPTTADSIYGHLHDPVLGAEAQKLADILQPQELVKVDVSGSKLQGKSFICTGTLSVKRQVIDKLVEDNGGVVASSVNKNLDYLILGADAGSKQEKAELLIKKGAPLQIIDEATFRAMIA